MTDWLHHFEQLARRRGFSSTHWGNVNGAPLLGFRKSGPAHAPRIYLSAGIHGDEPAGPAAIKRLLADDLLLPEASWTVCPLLNPGGWTAGTRETPDGIDMNRDYLDSRAPETIAHKQWIDRTAPHDLYLSLHEDWEATGFYLYEINTSRIPPFGRQILHAVNSILPIETVSCIDQHNVAEPGYIVHPPEPDEPRQWPEAIYHLKRYPHLSYTFETPSSADFSRRVDAQIKAVQTAVAQFLQLFPQQTNG